MAAVGVDFLAVALPLAWPGDVTGGFVPAILLFAMLLGALAWVAGYSWRMLFGRVSGREINWMILFAQINLVVTMSIGAVVTAFVDVQGKAAIGSVVGLETTDRLLFLPGSRCDGSVRKSLDPAVPGVADPFRATLWHQAPRCHRRRSVAVSPVVRPHPPAHLWLESGAVHPDHRQRQTGAEAALDHDQKSVGFHRRPCIERLGADGDRDAWLDVGKA